MNASDFSCKESTHFNEIVKPGDLVWIQTYICSEIPKDYLMERCKVVKLDLYGKDENGEWKRDKNNNVGDITLEFIDKSETKTFKVYHSELYDESTGESYVMHPYTVDGLYLYVLDYFEKLAHMESNNKKLCNDISDFVRKAGKSIDHLNMCSIIHNIRH